MQGGVGGVGGGTGAPTAMNQLWGGPACKRLRTPALYYLFYYNVLHRIHVHIYLSGTILNGSFLQNIGDAEHIISPVCRF